MLNDERRRNMCAELDCISPLNISPINILFILCDEMSWARWYFRSCIINDSLMLSNDGLIKLWLIPIYRHWRLCYCNGCYLRLVRML